MRTVLSLLIAAAISGCYHQNAAISGVEKEAMPSFNLQLSDSNTYLNTNNIPTGKPIVVCLIGTHCPYSRAEIKDITDNINKLQNVRIYILTIDPFASLKGFYKHFQLEKYRNITMARDTSNFFGKYIKANAVPYTALYDKEKKLTKVYRGKIDANLIKNMASE